MIGNVFADTIVDLSFQIKNAKVHQFYVVDIVLVKAIFSTLIDTID